MRKVTLFLTVILLLAALFAGCGTPAATEPSVTEAPVETAAATSAPTEAAAESSVFCSGPVVPAAAEESGTSGFPPFISISVKGSVGIETTELSVDACPDSEGAELV